MGSILIPCKRPDLKVLLSYKQFINNMQGSFPRGPGGRVVKLEAGLYDEHSDRATSITNTRLKVQEERFIEYDSKVPEVSSLLMLCSCY